MNYREIYDRIISYRRNVVPEGYKENHHILPRSLGGSDDKDNLVYLTAKEHFICHLLLTRMYEYNTIEYYKMIHAFHMMQLSSIGQKRYITSRSYEYLKIDFSKKMSIEQSGSKNSNFGKIWINSPTLRSSKVILITDDIENGWYKGRVVDWNLYFKKINGQLKKKRKLRSKDVVKSIVRIHVAVSIPFIELKVNRLKEIHEYYNSLNWYDMYDLYKMYGYAAMKILTNIQISREAFIMHCKKRLGDYYTPSQKTKRKVIYSSKV